MSFAMLAKELSVLLKRWFAKRNIIIVSKHGVRHVPVTPAVQLAVLAALVSFFCWASFSTGSFMAARSALKEQNQALQQVTQAYVSKHFKPAVNQPEAPLFTHEALDNQKMISRVAYLEHKVDQLQNANAEIIQRVQEKTSGRIEDIERLIKQTGLDAEQLKRNAESKSKSQKSQGGPYIPSDMNDLKHSTDELFSSLDELSSLSQLLTALPLGIPIKNSQPQSGFGHRYDPFTNRLAFHSGLDLAGPSGSKIYSTADGIVESAEWSGAYGNMIEIDHGNRISTRYGHLSQIRVAPGQRVKRGDWIGVQGSTGRSTGAHLHYEVRFRGEAMNPKKFLEASRYVSEKL
ncbi:MAG: M23 family metallopeptidase [Rickettsiales bacterium]|jgi:murein DD-endopeptidase MepM/ murein hydrolase activator NlpD|nr:M23 family metallopeptidase [Rickettsiales bacterium]